MKEIIKKRESNIELLRIVLMFMIILFHLIVHGCNLIYLGSSSYIIVENTSLYAFILSFTCVSVNCFIFISGYYSIKFKTKSLLKFNIQGITYSVLIYLFVCILGKIDFNVFTFIKAFFPVIFVEWWFLTTYIGLYIISPILNKGIESISRNQLLFIVILLIAFQGSYIFSKNPFISSNGLSILTMIIVYITARFCKLYIDNIRHSGKIFIFSSILLFISVSYSIYNNNQELALRLIAYNSPIVIINSIFLFYYFKNLKIQYNVIINYISKSVFGIYLIHDAPNICHYLYNYIRVLDIEITNKLIIIPIIGIALIIFFMGFFIETIRSFLTKPILNIINNNKKINKLPFN